jgi:hypothetical protein
LRTKLVTGRRTHDARRAEPTEAVSSLLAAQRAEVILSQNYGPYAPDGQQLLRGLKGLYAECSAKCYAGFVPLAHARAVLMGSLKRHGQELNPKAPQDVRYVARALEAYQQLGEARVVDRRLMLPQFAVGNPDTGLLLAADMRRKAQKFKRRRAAAEAKRRDTARYAIPEGASKPDLRCRRRHFLRKWPLKIRGQLISRGASGELSRAASPV